MEITRYQKVWVTGRQFPTSTCRRTSVLRQIVIQTVQTAVTVMTAKYDTVFAWQSATYDVSP